MLQANSSEIQVKGRKARQAAYRLGTVSPEDKNRFLSHLAEALISRGDRLIQENAKDVKRAEEAGTSKALIDRLTLNVKRLAEISESLTQLSELPDPVGEILESWSRPNGMQISKIRVPLGVVAIIYEARPNVTVDSAVLCLKTGNACLLRGSSSALDTNKAIVAVIRETLRSSGLPEDAVQLIEDTRRESIPELLRLNAFVDVVIPRGGADLIQYVIENATVPVIETGAGNCHIYIHKDADVDMALKIAINAKVQRPSVCNAAETILVHSDWAEKNLATLVSALRSKNVECRGCERSLSLVSDMLAASEQDWLTEYLDLIVAIKVVDSLDEAIEHINRFGTHHSETIISASSQAADKFFAGIDSAALYHNVSTRFTDGFEYGFGAEIGISNQKLHARGPLGLKELTSYKFLVRGNGQIRT